MQSVVCLDQGRSVEIIPFIPALIASDFKFRPAQEDKAP